MKKRILALTVCLAMLFSLTAFAADEAISGGSSDVSVSQAESIESAEPSDDSSGSSSEETPDVSSEASSEESAVSEEESGGESSEGSEESGESSEVSEESSEVSEESGEESSETSTPSQPEEFTAKAAYDYLLLIQEDKEAFEAYLDQLTPEQLAELVTYTDTLEENSLPLLDDYLEQRFPPYEFLTCENDSNAAPLMEYVLPKRSMFRAPAREQRNDNGLVTSKTVTDHNNGTYTLRLESYATGATYTTETSEPTDIVLVLDTSGSMDEYISVADKNTVANLDPQYAKYYKWQANFGVGDEWREMRYKDGKWQYEAGSWPIFFWKDCGDSWFGNAAGIKKIDALKIAVDGFLTSVGEKGKDNRVALVTYADGATLKNDLTTDYEAIKSEVWNLSAKGATYADEGMTQAKTVLDRIPADRDSNKVVIMFTDGEPNHGSGFNRNVANSAIGTSRAMKDSGVTVYTIGVFENADNTDITRDFNRYMNYVSNNYPYAENMDNGGEKYEHPDGGSYYLTADNLAVLEEIFQNISNEVGGAANSKLNETIVVKDVISEYFQLPDGADAADITVKTADCTSFTGDSPNWTNEQVLGSLTADDIVVNEQTISVKGFNFSENYVGKNVTTGVVHAGKKLIVEIPIVVRDGFLGGNDVPTNGTASGVYDKDGTLVENFNVPTVDVDIPDVAVTAADKNIYLLGSLAEAQLKEGAALKAGNVPLTLAEDNYGLESWQNEYVNITVEVKDKGGSTVTALNNLEEDQSYTVSLTVSPKTTGSVTKKTGSGSGKINVFTPELTFQDGEVYYGDTVPTDFTGNLKSTVWKHGEITSTSENVTLLGDAPVLTLTHTPDSSMIADGRINTKQDVPVDVTVKISETYVTDKTTFVHADCTDACSWNETTLDGSPAFLLHVKTCQLTITKQGGAAGEPYVFTVYKDGVKYSEVTIVGNTSETIYELPVGTYTIKEDTGWSWRYTPAYTADVTLSKDAANGTITCTNTKTLPNWLNGFSDVIVNIFGVKPEEGGDEE